LRLVVYRAAITAVHANAAGDDRRNLNIDPHNIVVSRYRY
jgi:hypothetical protein